MIRSLLLALLLGALAACGSGNERSAENCTNGVDDDGNGLVDCADPACHDDLACARCGDGVATGREDCDGTDLRGKQCSDFGFNSGKLGCTACVYDLRTCAIVEICDNHKDDDGDGLVDCADPDCADSAACAVCGDGQVTGGEQCDDGMDTGNACCVACRAQPGCEIERNDVTAKAMSLAVGADGRAAVRGWLHPAGDLDVFAVAIPAGSTGTLVAETSAPEGVATCADGIDTFLEILDDHGARMASDDDSGEATCSLARAAGLPAGLAYVRVSASPLALVGVFGYRLALTLSLDPCGDGVVQPGQECDDGNTRDGDGCSSTCRLEPKAEREPDDTQAQANGPYAVPFAVNGSADPPKGGALNDDDWYAVDVAAASRLAVETVNLDAADCGDLYATPALYRADGGLLVDGSVSATGTPGSCGHLETDSLTAGRYYVKVAARPTPGHYRLVVRPAP
jgi:cysteine-rich repeat protein